jgi:5-methylcytosine-specific restriction endonuclease McrA
MGMSECANGCGQPAEARKPYMGGRSPAYCGDKCHKQAKSRKVIKARKKRTAERRSIEPMVLCANGCGKPSEIRALDVGGPSSIYCGDKCREEATKSYHKQYREDHDEKDKAEKAKWQEENRESYRAANKRVYEAYPQKKIDAVARYRTTPSGRALGQKHSARRRASKRDAFAEDIDRNVVFERDQGICGICHKETDRNNWHMDHIIPLGPGLHCYENVRVTHPKCNQEKIGRDKQMLAEWRKDNHSEESN